MQHPEEGLIHAWIDGALPAAEAAELESHVTSCAECATTVAEARGLVAASSRIIGHLDAVPGNVIPAKRPKKLWSRSTWPGAIAATLLVAVGLYATRDKQDAFTETGITLPALTPGVIVPTVRDSMPVVAPPAAGPVAVGAQAQARQARTDIRVLPPATDAAIPELQKSSATSVAAPAAPAPVAAALPRSSSSELQLRGVGEAGAADNARRAAGGVGTAAAAVDMSEQRAARMRAAREMTRSEFAAEASSATAAFVGCYEMSVSTDILPARFALVADSSAVLPGLLGVRYLDGQGNLSDRIVDAGWTVDGSRAVIRSPGKGVLLTLTRTGSAVTGSSPNGLRSGRVAFCR
jgi:hypothetical protein